MELGTILTIAIGGIIIAIINQALDSVGKKEMGTMISIIGVLVALFLVVGYMTEFFHSIETLLELM